MTNAAEKIPDFFKVFLPERHSEGMFIPKVKLKLFEENVIKVVILRNRSGRIWHVKVRRPINGQLCFEDGWKRFREENSLKAADFLVFTYLGNNEFNVKILERSSKCEKIMDGNELGEENDNIMDLEEEEEQEKDKDSEEGYDYDDEDDSDFVDDENIDMDEDYDDSEDDENTDKKEQFNANMKRQSYCSACKSKIDLGNVGSCSFTKVDPQLEEDYETDEEIYVQPNNPYFVAKLVKSRPNELHIPKNIIKDFSLSFPKRIAVLCCKCKNLKPHSSQNIQRNEVEAYHLNLPAPQTPIPKKYRRGQVSTWKDGRVCINGWADFCEKYKIEETDVCICEIVMRQHNMVEMLRVHVRRSIKE